MNLRPMHDKLVVERLPQEEVSQGGIFIPDAAREKPQRGKVVAAGPGTIDPAGNRRELDVKVGDVVVFGKFHGGEIELEGRKVLFMKESDVLAVLSE